MASSAGGRVSVIIVNYRTPDLTIGAVRSAGAQRGDIEGLRVVVADGGSADGSAERLAEAFSADEFRGWVQLLALPINGGFGWANSQAILSEMRRDEPPEFIFLLNPDAEALPAAIAALRAHHLANHRCGAAGAQLIGTDGQPESSAHYFPSVRGEFVRGARTGLFRRLLGSAGDALPITREPQRADWVSGAAVMFRVEALRETGLFDDGFFLYFEEVELMWRLKRANWETWYVPAARVRHVGAAATGAVHTSAKRMPRYWYESQRRYFALTQGRAGAAAAYGAWLGGHAFWLTRHWLRLKAGPVFAGAGRDRLRYGFPGKEDAVASVIALDSAPGHSPSWMNRRR